MKLLITKICLLAAASFGLAACSEKPEPVAQVAASQIEVWKTPTCGCCNAWIEHLRTNGFDVVVNDVRDTGGFRAALGMPNQLGSCHSAKVAGYAIEGHVPAEDIKRLVKDKPDAVGLSVPGMPMGSPGMEHPEHPEKRHAYDVLLVKQDGSTSSYSHYEAR